MVSICNTVQNAPIVRMMNSVLVGTMKFTCDQFDEFFNAENPAPTRLASQFVEFKSAYNHLNAAYALTRESLLTNDIFNMEKEGDQLYLAIKETSIAAQRMAAVPARKQAGDRNMFFLKKYRIDKKENMISEWSKLQQMCEEANASAQITADMATLGLTEALGRLTVISVNLRYLLTQRANELPEQQAMKQAREVIYPEYRALIDLLNAYAMVDENVSRYASLIHTLNRNIDYVRIHAMTNGGSSGSSSNGGGSLTPDPSPEGEGNEGGSTTGTGGGTTPDPGTGGGASPDPSQGGGNEGGDNNGGDDDGGNGPIGDAE